MPKTKPKATKSRSAVSGRYVSKSEAKRNPRETVTETSNAVGIALLKKQIVQAIAEAESRLSNTGEGLWHPRLSLAQWAAQLEAAVDDAFSAWQHALRAATLQEALDTIQKGGK